MAENRKIPSISSPRQPLRKYRSQLPPSTPATSRSGKPSAESASPTRPKSAEVSISTGICSRPSPPSMSVPSPTWAALPTTSQMCLTWPRHVVQRCPAFACFAGRQKKLIVKIDPDHAAAPGDGANHFIRQLPLSQARWPGNWNAKPSPAPTRHPIAARNDSSAKCEASWMIPRRSRIFTMADAIGRQGPPEALPPANRVRLLPCQADDPDPRVEKRPGVRLVADWIGSFHQENRAGLRDLPTEVRKATYESAATRRRIRAARYQSNCFIASAWASSGFRYPAFPSCAGSQKIVAQIRPHAALGANRADPRVGIPSSSGACSRPAAGPPFRASRCRKDRDVHRRFVSSISQSHQMPHDAAPQCPQIISAFQQC